MKTIENYIIHSNYVKDDLMINISLPTRYNTDTNYPIIVCLDSNIYFGLVSDTVRLMQFGDELPQAIVVGVGYPNDNEHIFLRNRDYLPTISDEAERSGYADEFHEFLIKELIPNLQSRYNIDLNEMTLLGDSYSGLFVLYSLFKRPNEFKNYISGSPSIYYDNAIIFEYEQALFESNKEVKGNIFLSVGSLEATEEPAFANMVGNVLKMSERLKSRNYALNISTHVFENETHLSVIPATFSRGLREVNKY